MNALKQTVRKSMFLTAVTWMIASLLFSYTLTGVFAQSEQQLRDNQSVIEAEIAANEAKLADLEAQSQTLEGRIAQLNTQITTMNKKIQLTASKINDLTKRLRLAEDELERQKGILAENLRTLYIEGDVSTLELLFATDNFGDFFQEQQYLERLKISVQESTEQVIALKEQIEVEKAEQERLQEEQQSQKRGLQSKQDEQQQILNVTRGQEAEYQNLLSDLEKQRVDAEQALIDFLASQSFVSLGSVQQGQAVGYMGNTGYSTGAHLHFGVWENGAFTNPLNGGGTLRYGFIWPTPSVPEYAINQYYGCQTEIVYLTACQTGWLHSGLDMGGWQYEGTPVLAAGSGDIVFRGWYGGYGNLVIVDHGNGVQTYYAHLLN